MAQTITRGLVSVIIPVFNGEAFLCDALESVFSQTFENYEIIVVDDGSTDGTREIVENYKKPISYFYQSNAGAGAARNNGVDVSRGEFIAFLDADDCWLPDKLEIQASELARNQNLEAVTGYLKNIHQSEWRNRKDGDTARIEDMIVGYSPTAILVRRNAFSKVGKFETESKVGEVVDWFVRAKEAGLKIGVLKNLFVWRRIHGGNNGIQNKAFAGDYLRVLKRSIDRRRALQIGGEG